MHISSDSRIKSIAFRYYSDREEILFKAGIVFSLFVFVITLIRSAVTAITYDEAYTYLFIARENMLDPDFLLNMFSKEGCIANNHWLNSFLIFFVTRFIKTTYRAYTYSEFMIRLPILAAYAVYLFSVCSNFRKKNISFPVLIFLVGNYYLNEFYGLARGYGMANTFIFLLCMSYLDWKRSGFSEMKHLNAAMIWGILAVLSNTIVLLLYPAVGLICLYRLLTTGNFGKFMKRCGAVLVVFAAVCLLMLKYHLNISSEGKPLYTGETAGFFDCFVKGYLGMFISSPKKLSAIAMLFTVLTGLSLLKVSKRIKELDFSVMLIIFVLTNLMMEMIFHKGYITQRILLAFYAFVVLAVCELFAGAWNTQPEWRYSRVLGYAGSAASVVLCILGVINFSAQIELRGTKDWADDYKYRTYVDGSYMSDHKFDKPWNTSVIFYKDRNNDIIDAYNSFMR
ncbi:MAG: hypothetical protein IJI07_02075 [Flexilinea sp.]|nr:hypothetical protein [Flexilinea sp.]